MANKGGRRHLKTLAAPRTWNIERKTKVWVMKTSPGAHAVNVSIPIGVAIRDMLGLCDTMSEAKKILNSEEVMVDGRVITDPSFGIGFMDIIAVKSINKYYRTLYDMKGRIRLIEIPEKNSSFKLCKIRGKTMVRGGRVQLNLHDGRNCFADNGKYRTGDVVKISVPEQKITEHFPLAEGNLVYISGGKHAGKVGTVTAIQPGTITREPMITLKTEDAEVSTNKVNAFVIGRDKPEIKLGD